MDANTDTQLRAIGNIAKDHGVEVHQVDYIIKRDRIQIDQRTANIKLFGVDAVTAIQTELHGRSKKSPTT